MRDYLGTVGARTGFTRNNYKVIPGLYCVGDPDEKAPVLVTANYKLTFDALRRELSGQHLWVLVIDTRGINVWCAAGKGTFSAEEIAFQVERANLVNIVSHRELLLPQLSANGVAAHELKKLCGFRGRFGPIQAAQLPAFLKAGVADEDMRTITFTLWQRAVLIPLEICLLWKPLLIAMFLFVLMSGISPHPFSLAAAVDRSATLTFATLLAILAGAAITPLLLPWIPARQFWLKGAIIGWLAALLFLLGKPIPMGSESLSLALWIGGCSSYLAMNFTGATPFTSLTGVAKEMRKGLPFQIGSTALALIFWICGPFF